MEEPAAELDARFSEPGAEAAAWADAVAVLEAADVSWIATVDGQGRPHVTPLVAVWLEGSAYFCTGPGEQKARNLAGNPRVTLSTGSAVWSGGLDVVVEGEARRVTRSDMLERLAAAWADKWDGRWRYEPRDGEFHYPGGTALVFGVAPSKVLSFSRGPFAQTRYVPSGSETGG